MLRYRQVRLGYPQALIQLAVALARDHGKREVSRAFGLPMSTIYRWVAQYSATSESVFGSSWEGHENEQATDTIDALIAECERLGFDVRHRVRKFAPNGSSTTKFAASIPGTPDDCEPPHDPTINAIRRVHPMSISAHWLDLASAGASTENCSAKALSANVRERVCVARKEIDLHYYSRLSCAKLAHLAGMSRFHFIKTFKAAFTVSPYSYLTHVRIHHAKHLLDMTHQPLQSVAAAVGFESVSSLCRSFKRVEGVSLSDLFSGVRLGSRRLGSGRFVSNRSRPAAA